VLPHDFPHVGVDLAARGLRRSGDEADRCDAIRQPILVQLVDEGEPALLDRTEQATERELRRRVGPDRTGGHPGCDQLADLLL
jgi:hypothetical protein